MKTKIRTVLVLLTTVILVYLLLRKVGLAELIHTLRQADPFFVFLSFCLLPLLILLSVIKWQILLKSKGHEVSISYLFKLYLVGYFFNNFLPSNVGGDLVRGYELGTFTGNKSEAMASVFMERLTGLIVLVVIATISFITNLALLKNVGLTLAMLLALTGLGGLVYIILDPRPVEFVAQRIRLPILEKYVDKFQRFHACLLAYKDDKRTLILVFIWSLLFYVGAILNTYVSALAFHKPISLVGIAVIVPIIMVISMIPLTFNGIGIQEWAYVLLFTWLGIPGTVGLSAILLIRTKNIVAAAIGGLIYPSIKLRQDIQAGEQPI